MLIDEWIYYSKRWQINLNVEKENLLFEMPKSTGFIYIINIL